MLAREGGVFRGGIEIFRTPLLIPSFSSKGFPELKKIVQLMGGFITGPVLVSAYDVHYGLLASKRINFPSSIFLDSGGYEARVEHDLSEAYGQEYKPKQWTARDHRKVLAGWRGTVPTVAVSYDNPRRRSSVGRQLESALKLREEFPNFLHEFLVKPERKGQSVEPAAVATIVGGLGEFSAVGFTENELGSRVIGRMERIAKIRRILDEAGITIPVHIFGSLDTLSTVLYFVAGAEIFDGLTWLRFGFYKGHTLYRQNYGAVQGPNGILKGTRELSRSMWKDNYYYLESLRDQMCGYVRTGSFKSFEHVGEQVEAVSRQLHSRVPG